MKLLLIIPNYEPAWRYGGVMKSAVFLARGLQALGTEVTVYTMNTAARGELLDVPLRKKVVLGGVNVYYFPPSIFRARDFHSRELIRFMEKTVGQFDAVYVSAMWQFVGVASARVARRHGIPFIMAPHGSFSKIRMRTKRLKKFFYTRILLRSAFKNCAAIHFCSEYERQTFTLAYNCPGFIVPNPVDGQFLGDTPAIANPPQNAAEKILITAGRPDPIKGFDLCIKTIHTLQERGHDITLKILGAADSEYGNELRHYAQRLGVTDRVKWVPFVTGDALLQEFLSADAYISLGRDENFCIAAAEALCLGLPAICAKTVGVSQLIKQFEMGKVCDLDPASAADAAEAVLLSPTHASRAQIRERARNLFSKEKVAQKFCDEWAKVSQRKNAGNNRG